MAFVYKLEIPKSYFLCVLLSHQYCSVLPILSTPLYEDNPPAFFKSHPRNQETGVVVLPLEKSCVREQEIVSHVWI